jgi:tetratricopeptide (TPR) repeat protein
MARKIIFSIILVLIPVLIVVLFEVSLRLFNYGTDLRLFQKSQLYPGYYQINQEVGKRYFRKLGATTPTNDIFLIEKPDTCYRIFVLGCSTTRGFPYQSGTMFSRILNFRLKDIFPHKRIELVNLSFSAINSFAAADMIDEVMENKPDAILIYTGHNEYYGTLGVGSVENGGNIIWLKKLHLKLIRFRTYQAVQQLVLKMGNFFNDNSNLTRGGALMEHIARDKSILLGSELYKDGINQFKTNFSEILKKAKKKNVPVILSEIVSNIRDQQPFKSESSDTIPSAIDVFNKARSLEADGKYDQARALYYKAKDLDVIRFRAPEDFNRVLTDLGKEFNCPVIPMKKIFEDNSPHGLIGYNLILEHLHPNIDGYFLMADAFLNTLKKNNFISRDWNPLSVKPSEFYRNNWGFTELDSLIGDLKIKMLKSGWPFIPGNEINIFMSTYKPKNLIDSLAFRYVSNDSLHIEDQHVYLAKVFNDRGEYFKAFKEYQSLIACYPYVNDLYISAARYLISDKQYARAVEIINSAPNKDENFDYFYTLGTLNLDLLHYNEAIQYFNIGGKLADSKEKQKNILVPLRRAYLEINDTTNASAIFNLIKSIDPDFEKKQVPLSDNDLKIKNLINQAIEHIKLKQPEKALNLLITANAIKETTQVNKMIGSVLFMLKDVRAYNYYQKAFLSSPNDPEILNNLFLLSLMRNDIGQAQFYLDKLKYVSFDYKKIQNLERLLEKKSKELKKE